MAFLVGDDIVSSSGSGNEFGFSISNSKYKNEQDFGDFVEQIDGLPDAQKRLILLLTLIL